MSDSQPNYTRVMLTSQTSMLSGMCFVLAGIALSCAFGPKMLLLLPLLFLGLLGAAALVVPDLPTFRRAVDQEARSTAREQARDRLISAVNQYWPQEVQLSNKTREAYRLMTQRLDDLRSLAKDPKSAISSEDLERLDDVTVDYLRLMHAALIIGTRRNTPTKDVDACIADLRDEMSAAQNPVDRNNIAAVMADLERNMAERSRLPAKEAAIKARLLAMSEAFEELYHRVNADPTSDVSDFLTDANAKLSI